MFLLRVALFLSMLVLVLWGAGKLGFAAEAVGGALPKDGPAKARYDSGTPFRQP